jgi:hypothetical protein
LGIDAPVVPYPAHASIEEGKRLRGDLPGAFTKLDFSHSRRVANRIC